MTTPLRTSAPRIAALLALLPLAAPACSPENASSPETPWSPETGALTASATSALAPAGLSIVAWNLRQFPLKDSTPERVASLVDELSPDVVGVQEIDDRDAFDEMADALPGYTAVVAEDPDSYSQVGMLYREDRVSVSEIETLFPHDNYAFPRGPLKAHVTLRDGSFDFDLLVLHLKAMPDPKSQARRRAACERLDRWVTDRIATGADPDIVLAGDFNDSLADEGQDNVFEAFLSKPLEYRFLTAPVHSAGDYSYIPKPSLIDHVLVTTPVLEAYGDGTTEALHLEKSVPGYVKTISDHRPVLSRFRAAGP